MTSERIRRQVDRLLDEADEAALRLELVIVRDRAKAALAYDPDNADARAYLATAERGIASEKREGREGEGQGTDDTVGRGLVPSDPTHKGPKQVCSKGAILAGFRLQSRAHRHRSCPRPAIAGRGCDADGAHRTRRIPSWIPGARL